MLEDKYQFQKKDFYSPLCNKCKNYLYDKNCKAFPEGIPDNILTGEFDHIKRYPGQDNNILFEPIKEK